MLPFGCRKALLPMVALEAVGCPTPAAAADVLTAPPTVGGPMMPFDCWYDCCIPGGEASRD